MHKRKNSLLTISLTHYLTISLSHFLSLYSSSRCCSLMKKMWGGIQMSSILIRRRGIPRSDIHHCSSFICIRWWLPPKTVPLFSSWSSKSFFFSVCVKKKINFQCNQHKYTHFFSSEPSTFHQLILYLNSRIDQLYPLSISEEDIIIIHHPWIPHSELEFIIDHLCTLKLTKYKIKYSLHPKINFH